MEHIHEKGYIPIMVEVNSLSWIIIGGGTVATRKVSMLLDQDVSSITVVAPVISTELQQFMQKGLIDIIQAEYKLAHLEGKHIVYAATDDVALNRMICREAKLLHLLVCNVSEQEVGNFITPSFFKRDDLLFSVSSQGKSPILTKMIADEWANHIDEKYVNYLPMLEQLRQDLKRDIENQALRKQMMHEATQSLLNGQVTDYQAWYKALLKHNC